MSIYAGHTNTVCLTCRQSILLCPVIDADVLILIIVLGNSEEVLSWKLICNVSYGSLWGGNPLKTKESLIHPLDQRVCVCQLRGGDRVKKGKIWALWRESAPQGTLEIHLLCLCVCEWGKQSAVGFKQGAADVVHSYHVTPSISDKEAIDWTCADVLAGISH